MIKIKTDSNRVYEIEHDFAYVLDGEGDQYDQGDMGVWFTDIGVKNEIFYCNCRVKKYVLRENVYIPFEGGRLPSMNVGPIRLVGRGLVDMPSAGNYVMFSSKTRDMAFTVNNFEQTISIFAREFGLSLREFITACMGIRLIEKEEDLPHFNKTFLYEGVDLKGRLYTPVGKIFRSPVDKKDYQMAQVIGMPNFICIPEEQLIEEEKK